MLTRKDLVKATGVPHYRIYYLTITGRLPMVHLANGKGDLNLYSEDAVQAVKQYLQKRYQDHGNGKN